MNTFLPSLFIRSAILILVGWSATMVMRNAAAASKNLVWRVTLLGLLVLPAMFVQLPTWDVAVEPVPAVTTVIRYVEQPRDEPESVLVPSRLADTQSFSKVVSQGSTPFDWQKAIRFLWMLASAVSIVPMLLGVGALSRTVRRGTRVEHPGFLALCKELGIQRPVSLRTSSTILTPATAGILRPVVLIPDGALNWPSERLNMVFRHELAHVARQDWFFRQIAYVVCVIYAPNPLVWFACNRLRAECEAACDDLVIAGGVDAKAYAFELLSIARNVHRSSLELGTVGMAHRANVESRLRAIVDPLRRRGGVSRRTLGSLSTCGLLAAVLVASIRIVNARVFDGSSRALFADTESDWPPAPIRDDVSDHPDVPPVAPDAKFTVKPYQPGPDLITVAKNGVAHLPNGVTVTLAGIAPSTTESPIWDVLGQEKHGVPRSLSVASESYGEQGYVPALGRSLIYSIGSSNHAVASTMGYVVKPEHIDVPKNLSGFYEPLVRDGKSNSFSLGPSSSHTVRLWFPGSPAIDRVTYRLGVAVGEWRSVMDIPNPFRTMVPVPSRPINGAGILTLRGVPSLTYRDVLRKHKPTKDRFVGNSPASDLVARRALILDGDGNLIRGGRWELDSYALNTDELRRCTHIVIQERELEWAEFRDVPLRPNLENDLKRAEGMALVGNAYGVARGFERNVPGLGTASVSEVVVARKQGLEFTTDGQPRWRADGKVLFGLSGPIGPVTNRGLDSVPAAPGVEPPTTIAFQYKGKGWGDVSRRLRVDGEPASGLHVPTGGQWLLTRSFPKNTKLVNVDLDIADGPWKVDAFEAVNLKPLPDLPPRVPNHMRTGLVLIDDKVHPRIIFLNEPTPKNEVLGKQGFALPVPPADTVHRFTAVLRDGSEWPIRPSFFASGPGDLVPNRHNEDPSQLQTEFWDRRENRPNFLASDVKQIRYEYRPFTKTIRFERVAIKPRV